MWGVKDFPRSPWHLPLLSMKSKKQLQWELDYWKNAYELLVKQTGRDVNDGYGLDPRKPQPRAPQ